MDIDFDYHLVDIDFDFHLTDIDFDYQLVGFGFLMNGIEKILRNKIFLNYFFFIQLFILHL